MGRDVKRDKDGWLCEFDGVPVERIARLLDHHRLATHLTKGRVVPYATRLVVNLKGCNGSGKSTVPMYMLHSETDTVYLTLKRDDPKPVATYCKTYNTVILGLYLTACGGCDYLGDTQIVKLILSRLWKKDVNIIFEGVIVGDIKSTFYEIMKAFNKVYEREISFCFMGTKFRECLTRIQRRNGGKPINEALVKSKYVNSTTHLRYYLAQGDVNCTVLDTRCTRQVAFERFMNLYPDLNPIF